MKNSIEALTVAPTLLKIAKIIEYKIDKKIKIGLMAEDRIARGARASLLWRKSEKNFEILYNPDALPSDAIICHELMHAIMVIEGFPELIPASSFMPFWLNSLIFYAFNTVLHVDVWSMEERFGYSEADNFNQDIINDLIPALEQGTAFQHFPEGSRIFIIFCHLCAGLLSPADEDIKQRLWPIAKGVLGDRFITFQYCYDKMSSAPQLSPQSVVSLIEDLFSAIQVSQAAYRLEFPFPDPDPKFREMVYNYLKM